MQQANTLPATMIPAAAAAVILEPEGDRIMARLCAPEARGARVAVRLALPVPYAPAPGDRVLLLSDGQETYVVGVLHAAHAPELRAGGARATAAGDALELRDEHDRLLFRYEHGAAEVAAPDGDLSLSAPRGAVRIQSALDVTLEAGRDVIARGARKTTVSAHDGTLEINHRGAELRAPRVAVQTEAAEVVSSRVRLVAGHVATTAQQLVANVERYELTATRIAERARTVIREVEGLLETRAGRARTLVERVFMLRAGRTVVRSERDTSIDGRKVLLG